MKRLLLGSLLSCMLMSSATFLKAQNTASTELIGKTIWNTATITAGQKMFAGMGAAGVGFALAAYSKYGNQELFWKRAITIGILSGAGYWLASN